MYALAIHNDAIADLELVWKSDEQAAATIQTALEEIKDSQYYLSSLSIEGFADEKIDVAMFRNMQRRGLNFWRLKLFEIDLSPTTLSYRIIYAYDGPKGIFYVLAIMHRDQDYENDPNLMKRLETAYDKLGLPLLPK